MALDKSKEILTSNCKISEKITVAQSENNLKNVFLSCEIMCSAFKRHLHNFIEKANFSSTYVEIFSLLITFFVKFNCLEYSNRCKYSSSLYIDWTLFWSRHPTARKAPNIWYFKLLLDLCILFAPCRNHKWEIKWGQDIMLITI